MSNQSETSSQAAAVPFFGMQGVDLHAAAVRLARPDQAIPAFSEQAAATALNDKATVLVLFRTSERAVADAIATGLLPSAALQLWCDDIKGLMAVQRKNRRHMILVEEQHFLQAPEAELSVLFERLQLDPTAPLAAALPDIDPLYSIFAQHSLAASSQISRLNTELEASSLVRPETPLAPEMVDAAFQTLKDIKAGLAAQTEAAKTAKALDLTRHQEAEAKQKTAAAERAVHLEQLQTLKDEVATQVDQLATAKKALADQAQAAAAAAAERILYLKQLQELQAEVETQVTQLATVRKTLADQEQAATAAATSAATKHQQDLTTLRQEAEAQQKAAAAERAVHLEQLQTLQDEVATQVTQLATVRKILADQEQAATTAAAKHKKDLASLRQEAEAKQKAAIAATTADHAVHLQKLQAEVAVQIAQLANAKKQISDQDQATAAAAAEHALYLQQLQELQAEVAAQVAQRITAKKALADSDQARQQSQQNAQTQHASFTHQIAVLQQTMTAVTETNETRGKALAEVNSKIITSQKALKTLESARASLLEQLTATEHRSMAYFSQIRTKDKDMVSLRRELAQTKEALQQVNETLLQTQAQETSLKTRVDALEVERAKLLSSHSWNVTKPLRAAHKMLGAPTKKDR